MVCIQSQVLHVLLKSLLDQGLIPKKIYEAATNSINSAVDPPEFFRHPDHCDGEEEHGCS